MTVTAPEAGNPEDTGTDLQPRPVAAPAGEGGEGGEAREVREVRIAVVIGSTRPGRTGPAVARWFMAEAERHTGVRAELVDLAEAELPAALAFGGAPPAGLRRLGAQLRAADGFVVVTPEYNHSFPASLKQAIDLTGAEWEAKPVAFVSYGGRSGGLRAVEQLRQVYPELNATTIRENITLPVVWEQIDAEGALRRDAGLSAAARTLLDQLAWWAEALRAARAVRTFPG